MSVSSISGANIAIIWKKFLQGGLTRSFLTDITTIFQAMTNQPGRFDGFMNLTEGGIKYLQDDNESRSAIRVESNLILGCMTAIKGLHFQPQAKAPMEALLKALKGLGKDISIADNQFYVSVLS